MPPAQQAPRLLTLFLLHLSRKRKNIDDKPEDSFIPSLLRILKGGLEIQRFPTFCAVLVGGSTLLQIPIGALFARLTDKLNQAARLRLTRWLSTFIAAWYSLKLLQSRHSATFIENVPHETATGVQYRPTKFAGRTMDLTLFAVTRALDVLIGELWAQRKHRRLAAGKWTRIENRITVLSDTSVFAASCALIMWSFIYMPSRLPRAYQKWINSAAQVDKRLITALRKVRFGEIKYGKETGEAGVLQPMCKDYQLPLDYGDPVKTIPFPCELVHMGCGPSCEYHALSRFARSFYWAFSMYLPLNVFLTIRRLDIRGLKRALRSSTRSSAFLATFIALYYYGICLVRTRLGPRILGTSIPVLQSLDGGYCIGGGCVLCGWSVLIESASRRKELGLFVAPRALATLLPRRYEWRDQWRENVAFAMSTAVVFTCVAERPDRVRGVLGKLLETVLVG